MKGGFRQSMAWLHTWSGLLVGWVLFAVFLTGTAAYLRPEITRWMRPEVSAAPFDPVAAAASAARTMATVAPDAPAWFFALAGGREALTTVYWRGPPGDAHPFRQTAIDPQDGAVLPDRDTRGGLFFYRFHFELYHLPVLWGRWIVSVCAAFMLVAIVSGIVTHRRIFADFFTFRPGKGVRAWMDGHAVAAVLALPYHLMITYTGLVTLMAMTLPWGIAAAYGPAETRAFGADLAGYTAPPRAGRPAPLTDLAPMLTEAVATWGHVPARMSVRNPGDAHATVILARGTGDGLSDHRAGMAFDGVTGAKLAEWGDGGPAMRTRAVLLGLHEGLFAGPALRALLVLSGGLGSAMVATGCVLWATKMRAKCRPGAPPGLGLRLVDVLNVSTIAGLPVAMAAFLWGNRLLPLHLADRAEAEINVFFAAWAICLLHGALRPRRRAWTEQWTTAALAWGLLPALDALTTSRHLGRSLPAGDWGMAGMDLGFLALGLAFAAIARLSAGPRRATAAWRPA